MKRLTSILLVLFFSFGSISTFADAPKIAVVDLQKIMQTSDEMKAIQAKLEQSFKPRRDKLMGMEVDLKTDMDTFKRDSSVMSQAKRKEAEDKIVATQQQFERDGQQYQQELSAAHNQAMEQFYDKIRAAISKVAAEKKYDLVLQKDAAPFSIEKLDVTEQVIQVARDAAKS
ncbi:MAG: OmpH family outer membrane protein [Gammaproteobacteria bacterium]|nr:OmpH family outer membrane protein [Gammaproteobacteria bacterium]MCH9717818.1 OmpH family outer membrane protein [Gammaproteobacteria bacterium]MCH9763743.1 OmpH family outer membrane protein [Gammaproteobacteria bacterium]